MPPVAFNGAALIDELVTKIGHNCATTGPLRSAQNWRFNKQLYISDENCSPEKKLEKAIAKQTSNAWANQIPTSSGLLGATRDRHRNIDLGFRIAPGRFELIELKMDSDTPLYAAMELLEYAALYIYTRARLVAAGATVTELLAATTIHWRVLAPPSFYRAARLEWLQIALARDLQASAQQHLAGAVEMDFAFTVLPEDFDPRNIAPALERRRPATWSDIDDATPSPGRRRR